VRFPAFHPAIGGGIGARTTSIAQDSRALLVSGPQNSRRRSEIRHPHVGGALDITIGSNHQRWNPPPAPKS